jgi:hypothetical protein
MYGEMGCYDYMFAGSPRESSLILPTGACFSSHDECWRLNPAVANHVVWAMPVRAFFADPVAVSRLFLGLIVGEATARPQTPVLFLPPVRGS